MKCLAVIVCTLSIGCASWRPITPAQIHELAAQSPAQPVRYLYDGEEIAIDNGSPIRLELTGGVLESPLRSLRAEGDLLVVDEPGPSSLRLGPSDVFGGEVRVPPRKKTMETVGLVTVIAVSSVLVVVPLVLLVIFFHSAYPGGD